MANITEHKAALLLEVAGKRKKDREQRVRKQRLNQGLPVAEDSTLMDTEDDNTVELIDAILIKLGIAPASIPATSTNKTSNNGNDQHTPRRSLTHANHKPTLIAGLRREIAEDLQKHENEQRQTCIRAGGFWRYVGRPVFDRMLEVAERIDWRTGVIRKGSVVGAGTDGDGV